MLRALLGDCAAEDPESVPLLEAWLDRAQPDWRDSAPPPDDGPLTRAEALAILGLAEGASEAEIRAAHRRLMRTAHPDQGGTAWLAARLNAARDLLVEG
jgi:DnaJ-domain-containing protein 1